jgi:hypothetical protein
MTTTNTDKYHTDQEISNWESVNMYLELICLKIETFPNQYV